MKTLTFKISSLFLFSILLAGCVKEGPGGPMGPAGYDAQVYYSEWFSPAAWTDGTTDWFFDVSAPDLTSSIVETGIILAYVSLDGDLYSSAAVRPLPTYALNSNWSFLVHEPGGIEFTNDGVSVPLKTHLFRFILIPGNIPAKSASASGMGKKTASELRSMSYEQVCKLYNIPLK
jgi:hypothetical protein